MTDCAAAERPHRAALHTRGQVPPALQCWSGANCGHDVGDTVEISGAGSWDAISGERAAKDKVDFTERSGGRAPQLAHTTYCHPSHPHPHQPAQTKHWRGQMRTQVNKANIKQIKCYDLV